jgi:hypothetical protein
MRGSVNERLKRLENRTAGRPQRSGRRPCRWC